VYPPPQQVAAKWAQPVLPLRAAREYQCLLVLVRRVEWRGQEQEVLEERLQADPQVLLMAQELERPELDLVRSLE
jgi:hypothetical protein